MPVADLAYPLEVPGRRREAATGVLDRLEEDGRDGVGALLDDGLLDLVGRPPAERLQVAAEIGRTISFGHCLAAAGAIVREPAGDRGAAVLVGAVEVRVGHVHRGRHEGLERFLQRRDAGDGQGAVGGAVVGDLPADDLGLGGLAGELEVLLRRLPGGLDGLAAAGREEHPVEVARGVGRDALGQRDGGGVRERPEREEGELGGLLGGRLGELLATMTDLHDEQPGETVEVALAPRVPDVGALALDDHRDVVIIVIDAMAREVHPQMLLAGLLKLVVVLALVHAAIIASNRCTRQGISSRVSRFLTDFVARGPPDGVGLGPWTERLST